MGQLAARNQAADTSLRLHGFGDGRPAQTQTPAEVGAGFTWRVVLPGVGGNHPEYLQGCRVVVIFGDYSSLTFQKGK